MYLPLAIPPGIARNGTEYQAQGRWYDANLVRWYGEQLGPIGGWRKPSTNTVSGIARAILPWRTATLARWIAIGTHTHLYARTPSGTVTDITPSAFVTGNADESANTGYGIGLYGAGAYGTPRPDTGVVTEALTWDLDVYGDKLYACAFSDGRIVSWDLDITHLAAAVTNAPTSCRGVVVTEQGAIMALAAGGNARSLQWSDLNGPTVWTPSSTNQAGSVTLVTQGAIRRGIRLGAQVLILTDIDAHVGAYVGLPSVYAFQRVGDDCGVVSKGAVATIGSQAIWLSKSGFWMFDGGSVVPVPCDVWDYLQSNLNSGQRSKITAFHNHAFGEAWWLYPSRSSTEVDSYIYYDYRRQHWNIGSLARTCAAEAGVFMYPIMVDSSGGIYEHEVGYAYDGTVPHAESGPVQLGNGDQVMRVSEIVSDEATSGQVTVGFRTRAYPNGSEATIADVTFGTDGRAFPRFSAREARVRIDAAANDDWRVGTLRLKALAGGYR
jgi:hypothetical protein